MTAIVTIGIDLAKNVFAVHGADATGKPALVRPRAPRANMSRAQMPEPALSATSGHSIGEKPTAPKTAFKALRMQLTVFFLW